VAAPVTAAASPAAAVVKLAAAAVAANLLAFSWSATARHCGGRASCDNGHQPYSKLVAAAGRQG
jgi:hypothetical protein